MYFVMLGYTSWLNNQLFLTVFLFALGVIYGWPFCGVLGIPIFLDLGSSRAGFLNFLKYGIASVTFLLV